jgi:arginyl-tRNA synthetase
MEQQISQAIKSSIKSIFDIDITTELGRPEEQFGDFSTNIAMQLASKVGKPPLDIAEVLVQKLQIDLKDIAEVIAIKPGFINFTLSDSALFSGLKVQAPKPLAGKVVVAEYSDPNPFKVLHAGHLYTSIVGDAIANLLQWSGASVHRVNYGGDVGMHVAKTLWSMEQELGGSLPDKYSDLSIDERAEWMAERYVDGSQQFETSQEAKTEITQINKRVYEIQQTNDHDSPLAKLYWVTRGWSYEYFDKFYDLIGTKFEKFYTESEVQELGLSTVREELAKGVYEESEGAVVFKGEKFGLHTRVFINSEGLPTYEAKEVGLIFRKFDDYHFDKSIIITANEQEQYMAVVLKSIEQFNPRLVSATTHLTHGLVKLAGGVKMSSRLGNFLRAIDVLNSASEANKQLTGKDNQDSVLGAVKYSLLKTRMGGDIIYDPTESVSIEGNSGPYLQYAYARAKSILNKVDETAEFNTNETTLNPSERSLLRKMGEFIETVDKASLEFMPHQVCTYLYELAQIFNRFYEQNRVVGDDRQDLRVMLVDNYSKILKQGLDLLGIPAPETI